jgi:hypothetical protein
MYIVGLWRTKSEHAKLSFVARRPESEIVLSPQELEEFTRRLSMLSVQGIESSYQTAYAECRFDGKTLPPAAAVQQLVAAWRVLRKLCKG